jgi:hypothetical protein
VTGTPGRKTPGDQVFAKVERRGDAIVGLFNTTTALGSAPVAISTTAAAIGLPPTRTATWCRTCGQASRWWPAGKASGYRPPA